MRDDEAQVSAQSRLSLSSAFAITTSFRTMAVMTTFAGFPAAMSWAYLALSSGLKRMAEGWHVEGLADVCSAALDEAFAFPLAGLACHRGEASERSGLFVFEGSQLAYIGDELVCGNGTETLGADDDIAFAGKIEVGIDEGGCGFVDRLDLLGNEQAALFILFLEHGEREVFGAVGQCRAILDQPFTRHDGDCQ
jgi:hypothetical protein